MVVEKDLFGDVSVAVPKTEGIKYAGSKLKIIPHILQLVSALPCHSVLDAFSGTTRVSQAFAQLGWKTTANDVSTWSEVFGNCYLKSTISDKEVLEILDDLNHLPGEEGWFTQHYGADASLSKAPFQRHNTLKLDAIRPAIDRYDLTWENRCVLLTSLIYALDSVDSTLGHYSAYLSKWSPRSYKTMELTLPKRFERTAPCEVSRGDAFDAVQKEYDLVYLDPPYGSNNEKMPPSRVRYSAYYHIWKTIILNDEPEVFGKANRRLDTRDTISASVFEEFRKDKDGKFLAMKAIERLIAQTNAKFTLLSYASGGRATREELYSIINKYGRLRQVVEIDYKRNVMSSMTWTNEWLNQEGKYQEYLFLMERN